MPVECREGRPIAYPAIHGLFRCRGIQANGRRFRMLIQPNKCGRLVHGLPPVLGVDHASNAFYMWLGALSATDGTTGGRPLTPFNLDRPLLHSGP